VLRRQQPLSYRPIFPCFIASICRVVEELYANSGASKDCARMPTPAAHIRFAPEWPSIRSDFPPRPDLYANKASRFYQYARVPTLSLESGGVPHSIHTTPPPQIIIILHATIERISFIRTRKIRNYTFLRVARH
jgi:hypothetical protein